VGIANAREGFEYVPCVRVDVKEIGFLSRGEDRARAERDGNNGSDDVKQKECSDEHTQIGHDDASLS